MGKSPEQNTRILALGQWMVLLACALFAMVACGRADLPLGPHGCPSGTVDCSGECVDLDSNDAHCGACNRECAEGSSCEEGRCSSVDECNPPRQLCDGECVNFRNDANNCGACGLVCRGGRCVAGECAVDPECAPNLTECNARCVNTRNDPSHCGGCNNFCESGRCNGGSCQTMECSGPDEQLCETGCTNILFDPDNCGACGIVCPPDTICDVAVCASILCPAPLVPCGDMCINTGNDPDNCGGCGETCPSETECRGGMCRPTCEDGLSLCGDECIDVSSDLLNCGACGRSCEPNQICFDSECRSSCPAVTVLCGNQCVDTRFDPANCGACGRECPAGNACSAGTCVPIVPGCNWTVDDFPMGLGAGISVGDIDVDDECNLYVGHQPGHVYRIDAQTKRPVSILNEGQFLRGLVYRPVDRRLYLSRGDAIESMELDGSDIRTVENSTVGSFANGMALAPEGFGDYGGMLILARSDGAIFAIDPDGIQPPSIVGKTDAFISSVAFDGTTLFIAAYSQRAILTLSPAGSFSSFAPLPCEPDGIAIQAGVSAIAACGSDDVLLRIPFATREVQRFTMVDLNSTWAPSGLIVQGNAVIVINESVGLSAFGL